MVFKEINPSTWTYEKDGDFIEGILVRIQEEVGTNKAMLYSIENKDGVKMIWGSTLLDDKMALVKVGDFIRITFKGFAKEHKKGKNPAKIFKVEIDKGIDAC